MHSTVINNNNWPLREICLIHEKEGKKEGRERGREGGGKGGKKGRK